MLKRASYLSPDRIGVFATAVLRNISNSAQAIAAIKQGAGLLDFAAFECR